MTITTTVYEEVTILYSENEKGRAFTELDEGHWRIRYAGPVIKDYKVKPGKFKLVAYRPKE